VQAGNARCFFQHRPAIHGLCRDDHANPPLANKCGGMGAGCRIGKDKRDILGAHILAIDAIGRACSPFNPADNLQLPFLMRGIAFRQNRDFGKIA
jgi:hypothetical protein